MIVWPNCTSPVHCSTSHHQLHWTVQVQCKHVMGWTPLICYRWCKQRKGGILSHIPVVLAEIQPDSYSDGDNSNNTYGALIGKTFFDSVYTACVHVCMCACVHITELNSALHCSHCTSDWGVQGDDPCLWRGASDSDDQGPGMSVSGGGSVTIAAVVVVLVGLIILLPVIIIMVLMIR